MQCLLATGYEQELVCGFYALIDQRFKDIVRYMFGGRKEFAWWAIPGSLNLARGFVGHRVSEISFRTWLITINQTIIPKLARQLKTFPTPIVQQRPE